ETRAKSHLDLPRKDFAFARFPFTQRIDAEFTEHERLGIGDHLQAAEIIFERLLVVQIDVEAKKIEAKRTQKFRRWIIRERAKAMRVDAFHFGDQFVDEFGHRFRSTPAHDVRWNLIRHAQGEKRRMARATLGRVANGFARGITLLRRIEKTQMLVPRNI